MKGSIYGHMIEEGNFGHKATMDYAIASADYLKAYCQSLGLDRLLRGRTKLQQLIDRDSINPTFRTESGAVCNFSNCLVILSRYASSLHHTGAMTTEVYEEQILDDSGVQFKYIVRLPTNEQSQVKGAVGLAQHNKALAKRSAAFRCVGLLRAKSLLDENLNSIFHAVKPENLNARLAVSGKKDAYDMRVKPDFWQYQLGRAPELLYGILIDIRPKEPLSNQVAPLLLLTRRPLPLLPSFPMYLEDGVEATVVLTRLHHQLAVSATSLTLMTAYTLNAVFHDVFNKVYEHDPARMSYWLTPSNLPLMVVIILATSSILRLYRLPLRIGRSGRWGWQLIVGVTNFSLTHWTANTTISQKAW